MSTEFKREERYIVIKRKDLDLIGREEAESIEVTLEHIQDIFRSADSPDREYLVIESDWPEYEPAWAMIEARMTGSAPQPTALDGELKCWSCKGEFTLEDRQKCDGCCWKCGVEIELDGYVAPLLAGVKQLTGIVSDMVVERDTLIAHNENLKAERDTLKAQLEAANELLRMAYNTANPMLPYRIRVKIEEHFGAMTITQAAPAAKDGAQ